MIYEKILRIINGECKTIEVANDGVLSRHFLHNQNNDENFDDIKEYIINIAIKEKNISLLFKLLEYFEKHCLDNHSDEIIEIFLLLNNTDNENIKRQIAIISKNLKPKINFTKLYELLTDLVDIKSQQDSIVKEFALDSASYFADNLSDEQVLAILKLAFGKYIKEDVTTYITGGVGLRFKGTDIQDSIFANASKLLGTVLKNPNRVNEFIEFAMLQINAILEKSEFNGDPENPIRYNYIRRLDEYYSGQGFEYESGLKRLLFELWKALEELSSSEESVFVNVVEKIIDHSCNSVYFEILRHILATTENKDRYSKLIQKIVFKKDLRKVIELSDEGRYLFFSYYLSSNISEVKNLEDEIIKYQCKENKKLERIVKTGLAFTIPQELQSEQIKNILMDFEKETGFKWTADKKGKRQMYATGTHSDIDTSWLGERQTIDTLLGKVESFCNSEKKSDREINDLGRVFSNYFSKYPEDILDFYKKLIEKNILFKGSRFTGYISEAFVNSLKSRYQGKVDRYIQICELFTLGHSDGNVKMIIARYLTNDECLREKDTLELDPQVFTKIKKLVIDLAGDENPDEDKYEDFFNLGLNSVRGIASLALCILAFYYPKDLEIIDTIRKLSNDKLIGIQAYLVTNLVYLISPDKNYSLCEEIVNKYKNESNQKIDHALIHYMFRLGNKKLQQNLDYLEIIIDRAKDNIVLEKAGSLIGQALLHQVKIEKLFNKILSGINGSILILEKIGFEFQNTLGNQLELDDIDIESKKKLLGYYKKLLLYKDEKNLINERVSFLFNGTNLNSQYFKFLFDEGIFNAIIESKSIKAYHNLNYFLERCVKTENNLPEILGIIEGEINEIPYILGDNRFNSKIADIISYLYEHHNGKNNDRIVKIFDEGLKFGGDKFYKIFDSWYRN